MNINTLEYIHRLLEDEKSKTNEVYKAARQLQHEYEKSGTSKDLAKQQEKAADEYMNIYLAAVGALEDFESQEW